MSKRARKAWVGFDLGGTKMMAVVFDQQFKVLATAKAKTPVNEGAKAVLTQIRLTIREALHCSTLEAIFATIHVALTQGIFLTNYILDLGASNFECGIVESLPYLLQFTYFASPWLVRRERKPWRSRATQAPA